MPNPRFQKPPSVRVNPGTPKAAGTPPVVQKTSFPSMGVPGPTQPRDRSMGVRKIKTRPKEVGL